MVFYSVPITIRLLYQFHFLKSIFTDKIGRAAITSAIRKSKYRLPMWAADFNAGAGAAMIDDVSLELLVCDQLRKPSPIHAVYGRTNFANNFSFYLLILHFVDRTNHTRKKIFTYKHI